MVALPAFKFIFLAIRQLTRPVARQIVVRANTKKGITYKVCICLGRVSLGLTGVISEWNQAEAAKKVAEAKVQAEDQMKKNAEEAAKAATEAASKVAAEEAEKQKVAAAASAVSEEGAGAPKADTATTTTVSGDAPKASPSPQPSTPAPTVVPVAPTTTTTAATATATAMPKPAAAAATAATQEKAPALNVVTPRSRPLLTELVYGPIPRPPEHEGSCQNIHQRDTYDESVFYDKNRTVGEVARVFIRYPSRSAWDVFRRIFLSPFPEQRLVDAGADFLIELTAYFVLATLLFLELWQQSKTTAAKEAYLQQRLTTIEDKVNELVQLTQEASDGEISALGPAPELAIRGRLQALWHLAETSVVSVGSLVTPFIVAEDAEGKSSSGGSGGGQVVGGRPPVVKRDGKIVPQANLPKGAMEKPSKHDDTALMKRELEMILRENGMDVSVSPADARQGGEKSRRQ